MMMTMRNNSNTNSNTLKKMDSLSLKNKSSAAASMFMDYQQQINNRRSPHQIEFPTSPQAPPLGDEIPHLGHPQHPIFQTQLPDLFSCSACKEYGAGECYTCGECDYQLHGFCALAPPTLKSHPIHPSHKIIFFPKPAKGGILKSKCDVCAKTTKGCVFKCTVCNFQMHPCCAMLSTDINILVHPHTLRLLPRLPYSSIADPADFICGECDRRRSGRVYHCTVCDYHLHAVCAKNVVNGLQAYGFKGMDKPSMLRAAARVAKKVMKEFIGGLIEGIGEGVGQVLIQTAARGRCHPS